MKEVGDILENNPISIIGILSAISVWIIYILSSELILIHDIFYTLPLFSVVLSPFVAVILGLASFLKNESGFMGVLAILSGVFNFLLMSVLLGGGCIGSRQGYRNRITKECSSYSLHCEPFWKRMWYEVDEECFIPLEELIRQLYN